MILDNNLLRELYGNITVPSDNYKKFYKIYCGDLKDRIELLNLKIQDTSSNVKVNLADKKGRVYLKFNSVTGIEELYEQSFPSTPISALMQLDQDEIKRLYGEESELEWNQFREKYIILKGRDAIESGIQDLEFELKKGRELAKNKNIQDDVDRLTRVSLMKRRRRRK